MNNFGTFLYSVFLLSNSENRIAISIQIIIWISLFIIITYVYSLYSFILDYTLPVSCFPVIIMKKTSSAVTQVYHLPDPDERVQISNLFKDFDELLGVVCFPTDIVLDTTLNGNII